MAEKCIQSLTSHHLQFSKKEAGKYVKNAVSREILKNSKNQSVAHSSTFYFSKGFLIQVNQRYQMKIYHKPSCITCKKTISEVERMKADIEKRDFFKDPFSEAELKKIIKMSGKKPIELLRKRDKMYKELDLENAKKTDSQIIKLMVKYPGLILRPIIISKNKAFVGKVDVKNLR